MVALGKAALFLELSCKDSQIVKLQRRLVTLGL